MPWSVPRRASPSERARRHLRRLPEARGRRAVVTGATGGLGTALVRALLDRGASVVMTGRDRERGERARRRIVEAHPDAEVTFEPLDLASLASIRRFAEVVRSRQHSLDLLFAHAGVMAIPRRETGDGFEWQLGVNHLGHFALVGLLLPLLTVSPGSRVVVTTSGAALAGRIDFQDPMARRSYGRWRAYTSSKLANLLYVLALQRRLQAAGARTSAHAAHPGLVYTDLQTTAAQAAESWVERALLARVVPVVGQAASMGALPMAFAGLSEDAPGGELWRPRWLHARGGPVRTAAPAVARDREAQERLWRRSEEWAGVRYDLPEAP